MVRVRLLFRFDLVKNRSVRISFCSGELNRHQSKAGRGDARVVDERAARDRSDIVSWENKQSNNWRLFSAVFSPPRGALWCANVEAPFSRPTPSHAVPCTWKSPPATRTVFTSIYCLSVVLARISGVYIYSASSSASWPPSRRCWKHSVRRGLTTDALSFMWTDQSP